jgi:GT2 family glycosyltransferase
MVYIILVNWNGWQDTIECLESVFRLVDTEYRVIVCDNHSEDNSLDQIASWATGSTSARNSNPELAHLTTPPCPKPISVLIISARELPNLATRPERLILVPTGANLGFAGGCNVGLRLALASTDFEFAWLLNNDTVVDPASLSALVEEMRKRPEAGICGSTILNYCLPLIVQSQGGANYNSRTARLQHIGKGLSLESLLSSNEVEKRLKYLAGASMFATRTYLETIGLLNEDYFLYYEEIDWATRAQGRFSLAYCSGSLVYHKEGATTGSGDTRDERTPLTEFFATRSRVMFTRKYFPRSLPVVCVALLFSLGQRLLRGRWQNATALMRGFAAGLRPDAIQSTRGD